MKPTFESVLEFLEKFERENGNHSDGFVRQLCNPANPPFLKIHWDKEIGKAKVDGMEVAIFERMLQGQGKHWR